MDHLPQMAQREMQALTTCLEDLTTSLLCFFFINSRDLNLEVYLAFALEALISLVQEDSDRGEEPEGCTERQGAPRPPKSEIP